MTSIRQPPPFAVCFRGDPKPSHCENKRPDYGHKRPDCETRRPDYDRCEGKRDRFDDCKPRRDSKCERPDRKDHDSRYDSGSFERPKCGTKPYENGREDRKCDSKRDHRGPYENGRREERECDSRRDHRNSSDWWRKAV